MTLARPQAKLTIDGRSLSAAEAAVARIEVTLTIRGSHDGATVVAWPRSKLAAASTGSAVTVALGPAGDEVDVLTGELTAVSAGHDAVLLDAVAATIALSRHRTSEVFLDQAVEDVVQTLASEAGVSVAEVEAPLRLSAYAVSDRRSAWSHLLDLAAFAGADVGASGDGSLRFVRPRPPAPDHRLRFGADVLAWTGGAGPRIAAASVAAYGAGSEAGAEQWHWVLREVAPAGGGGESATRVVPALRTRDAADSMARALADREARGAVRGRLVLTGRPALRPGDVLLVADLPGDPGALRALEVSHVLDGEVGFVTTVLVEGAQ